MALHDDTTLVVGAGNYLTAVTGTAMPADLLAPGGTWANVGHTSLEDIFALSSEGGEATVLGTLQKSTLRTQYSARSESFAFTALQFDEETAKLFYGQNMIEDAAGAGTLGVPGLPSPTVRAFLAVFVDGDNLFAFYAPKAEIYRGDELSISDTESLAGLPLSVKPIAHLTNAWTYAITPLVTAEV